MGINEKLNKSSISITGRPGVGKTTYALLLVEKLKSFQCKVKGFITKEIREGNTRIGFTVKDLSNDKQVVLASKNIKSTIRVGSYYLNEESFSFIIDILKNLNDSDVIVIDEIGPMELKINGFDNLLKNIIGKKPYIITFYYKLKEIRPDIYNLLNKGEIIELNFENRNKYMEKIDQYAKMIKDASLCH
ncbi:putative nucleotide kinase [Caldisphaera lagunensis DSM 15908]|uniref:Nucleoside-triphosphatase Calag_1190 n=1 Tax=Caldisphaera lagunensis (strain DSM 15908 / JCM 11604 / ANMR 0165 / IC-154) TaxID=1056495 RepID=L0ACX9_CALLD|nr:nucleotide kinase [Caldisphaera lagunensis]AFZ70910.1 putative nucleotide kinase [Caldisphaera lagunensis DSM 15908]